MKNSLFLFCLSAIIIFNSSSCKREDLDKKEVTKIERATINVELIKNETYHYTLPKNLSDDPYQIPKQAEHFSVSELGSDDVYTYTPAYNYTGTDKVIIANVEEQHHDQGNNQYHNNLNNNGGCGNHDEAETERTITINFIIKEKVIGKHDKTVGTPSF